MGRNTHSGDDSACTDPDETCDAWFERFNAYQLALGQYGTRSQWRTWISPRIGAKRWSEVTSDDVEDLRDTLDAAILAWHARGRGPGRISGRTAMGVWWALRGAVRAARSSKLRSLRALRGRLDPCQDVQAPGDATSRQVRRKTFVYPDECAQLLACRRVPVAWRRVHAVAAYTYLRPNELRALRWRDVDLEHGRIRVSSAWSHRDGAAKAPKTRNGVRDVPIDRQLISLLESMRGAAAADLVLPLLAAVPRETLAARTRRHLHAAGLDREALHVSSLTTVRANFRSWRDSGLTWLAMSGLDPARIMRRAGHDDIGTTIRYVKQAEDVGARLGLPFGVLPRGLFVGPCSRSSAI